MITLSRFISKSRERNMPFFKNLRQASNTKFYWDDDCDKAFEELKEYLGSPILLSQLEAEATLQLYLAMSDGAALADFIIECTSQTPQVVSGLVDFEPGLNNPEWVLFVDGARNEKGSGVGVLIYGPDGVTMAYALRFTFPTTNNEDEFEAMVARLTIVKSLGIDRIWVKSDSKLIMDQVKGVSGVKHESLVKYHVKAIQLAKGFKLVTFEHIPRTK
ncbi:hypothetical protein LIER_29705 [Lithospermum erythrorhizon]|uniref:RNase H type-1 domain-containing protein n=1 Tax=Lithospermum erythrorhizon TaxID=34254 RepID=A0AAV3RNK4_LITER